MQVLRKAFCSIHGLNIQIFPPAFHPVSMLDFELLGDENWGIHKSEFESSGERSKDYGKQSLPVRPHRTQGIGMKKRTGRRKRVKRMIRRREWRGQRM